MRTFNVNQDLDKAGASAIEELFDELPRSSEDVCLDLSQVRFMPSDIVDHAILHAQRLSRIAAYGWRTARSALVRILADLEARAPGDPGVERLRQFIAEGDRPWAARSPG